MAAARCQTILSYIYIVQLDMLLLIASHCVTVKVFLFTIPFNVSSKAWDTQHTDVQCSYIDYLFLKWSCSIFTWYNKTWPLLYPSKFTQLHKTNIRIKKWFAVHFKLNWLTMYVYVAVKETTQHLLYVCSSFDYVAS